jgi:hypothetical protein
MRHFVGLSSLGSYICDGYFSESLINRMDPNKLRKFISARCVTGEGLVVSRREFRDAFLAWNGGEKVPRGLPEAMESDGFALGTKRSYGSDAKSTGVYSGVALRTRPHESTDPGQGTSFAATSNNMLILDGEYSGLRIRKVDDVPPKISVYDLIAAVTGAMNPRQAWININRRFEGPDELKCSSHKFAGQGQNQTPVVDARGAVKIINHLSGPRAARFRDVCADIVVRFAEGDESLVEEIRKNEA